ncbi:MAG TPA: helical backbone metal receptor, partial [Candidatus Tectomicrobia bacterium]|nr:helical backbone metal receptor [Candidatus Tectomicrobia bacterium]
MARTGAAVMALVDATGIPLALARTPRRIVSLVPSFTETLFTLGAGPRLVGCTIYCREPAAGVTGVVRIGGTKNPRLDAIRALRPDLVVANVEENLREHVETLRAWGLPVLVLYPRTVAEGIAAIRALGAATGTAERAEMLAAPLAAR